MPSSARRHRLQRPRIRDCNILDLDPRMDRQPAAHDALQRRGAALPARERRGRRARAPGSVRAPAPGRPARGTRSGCSAPGRRPPAPWERPRPPAGKSRSRTICRMSVACWKSFCPNQARSGSTRWKSLATMVSTPGEMPGPELAFPSRRDLPGHDADLGARRVHRLDASARRARRRRAPPPAPGRARRSRG